ncbi:MAG: hypothetical protein ABIP66_20755 [Gemmatimonadaceae bacterium]
MRFPGEAVLVLVVWGSLASPLLAQERSATDGGRTTSLGQPGGWHWSLGGATGIRSLSGVGARIAEARVGVYRELLSRVLGMGGVSLEEYSGARDTKFDGGIRARFYSPFARVGVGADVSFVDGHTRPMFTVVNPIRRGGLFRDGSVVRLDVTTGRDRAWTIGIEKPVFRRIPLGRTRPPSDHVRLTAPRPPAISLPDAAALREALATARDAALQVQRLCVPWLDHMGDGGKGSDAEVVRRLHEIQRSIASAGGGAGGGASRTLDSETRRLHAAVDRAFSLAIDPVAAAGDSATALGRAAGAQARAILLDEVLIPYDRLLGQVKEDDTTREFALNARGIFLRWLHVSSGVPPASSGAALSVFTQFLEFVEAGRADAHRAWGGSRFVWLPLQLGLLPEQHDSQGELDALVARATGQAFSEGNFVSYIINEQFQYQLSRTIREARDYHVLWTHDFRGYDDQGNPDEMAYRHVLRSYLAAMTAQVRAYDSTGTFPVYLIILDEWFYEVNKGRLWMELLERPTEHRVHLPAGFAAWEDSLGAAQEALRRAISGSRLLTAQRLQYGEDWLRNLVKVHVNITNASDPTFRSWRVATNFPMPDNWMRDHRKVAFYDLTEEDPYRGEAIFTGAGVGEHYANLSWEDRSLMVRGPAAVGLKDAARDLLLGQGIAPSRIPTPLRPRARPANYQEQVARAGSRNQRPLRALILQNRTGFDDKGVNVGKAVLYTLMPAGSVIKIPDSLWNGTFWGSALVGCALRGVRVLVIAPSLANAPARAFGSMVRSRELLWRLVSASRILAPEITASGGLLKVGMYDSDLRVTDIPGKVRSVRQTFQQHAWLRELFAFPPSVFVGLDELATTIEGLSMNAPSTPGTSGAGDFESGERSMLHLKANFFASREGWSVMARPEWVAITWEFVQQRIAQVQMRSAAVTSFAESPDALLDVGGGTVQRWLSDMPPAARARVIFYTIMGSQNQNDRSMVTDGEDALVLSNWPSVIPYVDLISIVGQSRWIDDPAEVDRLLPAQSSIKSRLAHWFKLSF